jgi:hypothetical protein
MNRIELVQGDNAVFRLNITDADCVPIDLTSFSDIFFTIKRSRGDTDAAAVFAGSKVGGDIVIVGDAVEGIIDVTIPTASTEPMRPGKPYYWDCKLEDSGDNISTVATGTVFADGTILLSP